MTIRGMYPRLVVSDAARAIEFYVKAFGAEEVERYTIPDGKIVHAELRLGGLKLAVKDEGGGDPSPTTLGGNAVLLALEVDDADAVGAAMTEAGATVVYPIADQPYGSRGGRLADPFGHLWMIDQKLEDLTPDEIQSRLDPDASDVDHGQVVVSGSVQYRHLPVINSVGRAVIPSDGGPGDQLGRGHRVR